MEKPKPKKSKLSCPEFGVFVHEGSTEACAHRVTYYFHCPREVDPELARYLDEEAESRARAMITEGYVSGELNYESTDHLVALKDRDATIQCTGWWQIER